MASSHGNGKIRSFLSMPAAMPPRFRRTGYPCSRLHLRGLSEPMQEYRSETRPAAPPLAPHRFQQPRFHWSVTRSDQPPAALHFASCASCSASVACLVLASGFPELVWLRFAKLGVVRALSILVPSRIYFWASPSSRLQLVEPCLHFIAVSYVAGLVPMESV